MLAGVWLIRLQAPAEALTGHVNLNVGMQARICFTAYVLTSLRNFAFCPFAGIHGDSQRTAANVDCIEGKERLRWLCSEDVRAEMVG